MANKRPRSMRPNTSATRTIVMMTDTTNSNDNNNTVPRTRPAMPSTMAGHARNNTGGARKFGKRWSFVLLYLFLVEQIIMVQPTFGLSGLVYTRGGYDNPNGADPICWSAPAFHNETSYDIHLAEEGLNHTDAGEEHADFHEHVLDNDPLLQDFDGQVWQSVLIPTFQAGPVTMELSCPAHIELHMDVPHEHQEGEVLRTDQVYHFHVEASLEMDEIRAYYGLSPDAGLVSSLAGESLIALQIKMCEINGGFCTPFAESHDHSDHNGMGELEEGQHDFLMGDVHTEGGGHDEHDEEEDGHEDEEHEDEEGHEDDFEHSHRALLHKIESRQKHLQRTLAQQIIYGEDLDVEHVGGENEEVESENDHSHEHEHVDVDADDEDSHHSEAHDEHENEEEIDTAVLESPIVLISIHPNKPSIHISLDIPLILHEPGIFLPLITMQLFMSNATIHGHEPGLDEIAAIKLDVANALHQRSLTYQKPPTIQEVSQGAAILSYVVITLVAAAGMVSLGLIFKYRHEKIMVLTQGSFLAVFQAAGVLAAICSIFFNPRSDLFCKLSGPMVLIPLQLMLAILFGRLRRIVTVMTPIMSLGANITTPSTDRKSFKSRLSKRKAKQKKLRQEYTAFMSCRLIFLATLPQIILQIVQGTTYPANLTLVMNSDESIGKYQCGSRESQWIEFAELCCIYVTLIVLLFESQRSKDLPALFNEATSIAQASIATIFIASAGLIVITLSTEPTSNPDVRYIMMVAVVLTFIVNLSYRLVLPKFQLIWSGEKVVVSRILMEHKRKKMEAGSMHLSKTPVISGLENPSNGPNQSVFDESLKTNAWNLNNESEGSQSPRKPRAKNISWAADAEQPELPEMLENSATGKTLNWTGEVQDINPISEIGDSLRTDVPPNRRNPAISPLSESLSKISSNNESCSSESTDLLILPGQAPPSSVTVAINDQAVLLQRVNKRILSGLEVPQSDWENLRRSMAEMYGFFGSIRYAWEDEPPKRQVFRHETEHFA